MERIPIAKTAKDKKPTKARLKDIEPGKLVEKVKKYWSKTDITQFVNDLMDDMGGMPEIKRYMIKGKAAQIAAKKAFMNGLMAEIKKDENAEVAKEIISALGEAKNLNKFLDALVKNAVRVVIEADEEGKKARVTYNFRGKGKNKKDKEDPKKLKDKKEKDEEGKCGDKCGKKAEAETWEDTWNNGELYDPIEKTKDVDHRIPESEEFGGKKSTEASLDKPTDPEADKEKMGKDNADGFEFEDDDEDEEGKKAGDEFENDEYDLENFAMAAERENKITAILQHKIDTGLINSQSQVGSEKIRLYNMSDNKIEAEMAKYKVPEVKQPSQIKRKASTGEIMKLSKPVVINDTGIPGKFSGLSKLAWSDPFTNIPIQPEIQFENPNKMQRPQQ